MLNTKKAKMKLTKKEQQHLTESGIHNMRHMNQQVDFIKNDLDNCCIECKIITKKLDLL